MGCVKWPMLHFLLILYGRGLSLVLKTLAVPQGLEQHPLTHGTWEGERPDSLSLGKNLSPTAGQRGLFGSRQDSVQCVRSAKMILSACIDSHRNTHEQKPKHANTLQWPRSGMD